MDKNRFGNFIYNLRKERKLTQKELAEILNVTDKAVSRWETGKSYPDIETLVCISEEFNVSMDEMLKGNEDMVRKITKEQKHGKVHIFLMLIIMLCIIFVYLVLSGTFYVHSSYRDVLSISKYNEIAEGDDWQIYMPEEYDDKSPYFKYIGDEFPKSNIHVKAVFYLEEDSIVRNEWYPSADRQFFFGEQRFYFPEDYNGIQKVVCKIIWNEYNSSQHNAAYVFSTDLNDAERAEALKYIDTIEVNENNNRP